MFIGKRNKIILVLLKFTIVLYSQQDYYLNHYMYDHISFNPSFGGMNDIIRAGIITRNQWTGIKGAPNDFVANISFPFKLFKKEHGGGIAIYREKIGFYEDVSLKLTYAYRATINNGKLAFGIGLNILNKSIKPSWYIPEGLEFSDPSSDYAIPMGEEKANAIDLSLGFAYYNEDLYIGVSSAHINETSYNFYRNDINNNVKVKINRHFYITSGYRVVLPNPSFEFLPTVFIQSDGKIHKLDITGLIQYNKKFLGGLTFSPGSSIAGIAGLELYKGLKLSFSYEFPLTSITNYYKTTYELMLNYNFKIGIEKMPQKYKSIRFL